jgi:hypothetical protein
MLDDFEAETKRLIGRPINRERMTLEEIDLIHEFINPYDFLEELEDD